MNSQPDRLAALAQGVLRIVIGFLFWSHGAQKLLGWFGGMGPDGGTVPLASLMGLAGIIEFVGGALIMIGLFTRPAAFIASGEMAVAFFLQHVPTGGLWPLLNQGEPAALYAFTFLFFAAAGAGALGVDVWRSRRRVVRRMPAEEAVPAESERRRRRGA